MRLASAPSRAIAGPSHQRRGDAVLEVDVRWYVAPVPAQDGVDIGKPIHVVDERLQLDARCPADACLQRIAKQLEDPSNLLQREMRELRRASGSERDRIVRGIEVEQELRPETQKGDDPRVDPCVIGPRDPVVQVRLQLVVGEPVRRAVPASRTCRRGLPVGFRPRIWPQPSGTRYSPSRRSRIN